MAHLYDTTSRACDDLTEKSVEPQIYGRDFRRLTYFDVQPNHQKILLTELSSYVLSVVENGNVSGTNNVQKIVNRTTPNAIQSESVEDTVRLSAQVNLTKVVNLEPAGSVSIKKNLI